MEDYNYIGWMQDVNRNGQIDLITQNPYYYQQHGPSTVPAIGINEWGNIYVLYASTTEGFANNDYNFKHIWMRANKYGEWGDFYDLTAEVVHLFDEC